MSCSAELSIKKKFYNLGARSIWTHEIDTLSVVFAAELLVVYLS